MKSPEPLKPEKSLLTLAPGDMIEVSLVMYELIGKTSMHSRKEIVLTLQDGKDIRYLKLKIVKIRITNYIHQLMVA